MLGDDKPKRELDETSASAADDRFEEILMQVKAAGGKFTHDEETPLIIEFNNEFQEIGDIRVVKFNFKSTDFQITRQLKNMRSVGEGHRKHLEAITRPIIEIKLKRKPELSDQWLAVDIDEMF